eukprot:CAMPEP_0206454724 /NCGR_PEP_ID=MMETSP0324_2-20121206/21314_1 /ASSEMBLY_ACC=CAM_ASM_000836 /TAXON_ID=2866 /ORGANISM="Crypthecodinium cohnii, Strain Seligo" /LENGTH=377 /DNA_ID=CAMNT_0053925265 /DNA_START=237 /DNA_END=1370 /DNA_ORIENTATION=+
MDESALAEIHEIFNSSSNGPRCCCRGPSKYLCRQLSGEILKGSSHCPQKQFYRHSSNDDNGDMKTEPDTCNADAEHPAVVEDAIVKVYWIRHGWSCANVMNNEYAGKVARARSWGYRDPPLTNLAIDRAKVYGEEILAAICQENNLDKAECEKIPLFSSTMIRAIETALWNFPKMKVRPIPFIAELGMSFDNKPLSDKEQWEKLQEKNGADGQRVLYDDITTRDHPQRSSDKSDYEHWKAYFPTVLAAILTKQGQYPTDNSKPIPVIVVSHSHFMKEYIDCSITGHDKNGKPQRTVKPINNEAWTEEYTVNLGAWDAVMEPTKCERLIKENAPFKPGLDYMCQEFVDRCGLKEYVEDWEKTEKSITNCKLSPKPNAI